MSGAVDKAGKSLAKWETPTIGEIELDVSKIANGFAPGTDGDVPGPPDTSMS